MVPNRPRKQYIEGDTVIDVAICVSSVIVRGHRVAHVPRGRKAEASLAGTRTPSGASSANEDEKEEKKDDEEEDEEADAVSGDEIDHEPVYNSYAFLVLLYQTSRRPI